MKKTLILLMTALSLLASTESYAHGWGGYHGGYREGSRGGYGYGLAPFVAGALIGGAVASASYASPVYYSSPVMVAPQTVYVQPQIATVTVQPHAYYCATAQNYYPNVQTCSVPWQQTN